MRKYLLTFLLISFTLLLNDCSSSKSIAIKKQIQGVWGIKGETVNDFKIGKDSIFYIDQERSYKYFFSKEDTLIIHFDGYIEKFKIVMHTTDTMITINTDSIKTYFIKAK